MTRTITATAFAVLLLGSASAYAASAPPISNASMAPTSGRYVAQCARLAAQWTTAEAKQTTNVNLSKAKADAQQGEQFCKSTKVTQRKHGVSEYRSALKLLGVTPI